MTPSSLSSTSLLLAATALLVVACGTPEVAPNPLTVGDEGPAEQLATPTEGASAGPAAPEWVEVAALALGKELLTTVETKANCCAGEEAPYRGSPARFYLGPQDMSASGDGYLLWMDAEGHVVLSHQSDPGAYDQVVHRSEAAAPRVDGKVTLTIPASLLPSIPLYIWAGTRNPSTVLGTDLPISLEEGGIPALLLTPAGGGTDAGKGTAP